MKRMLLSLIFMIFSSFGFSQTYNYTEEISSTQAKIQQVNSIVTSEFGQPDSPGIWISKDPNYGLMIRAKGNTFYIRAWEISSNSNIQERVRKLMKEIRKVL